MDFLGTAVTATTTITVAATTTIAVTATTTIAVAAITVAVTVTAIAWAIAVTAFAALAWGSVQPGARCTTREGWALRIALLGTTVPVLAWALVLKVDAANLLVEVRVELLDFWSPKHLLDAQNLDQHHEVQDQEDCQQDVL